MQRIYLTRGREGGRVWKKDINVPINPPGGDFMIE